MVNCPLKKQVLRMMNEKVVESVDDNDKADGFEELDEDVERLVGGKGTRSALPNCRNTDKAATR